MAQDDRLETIPGRASDPVDAMRVVTRQLSRQKLADLLGKKPAKNRQGISGLPPHYASIARNASVGSKISFTIGTFVGLEIAATLAAVLLSE